MIRSTDLAGSIDKISYSFFKNLDFARLYFGLSGIHNKGLTKLKKYNSYHTSIKQLAKRNKLPNKYSEFIDRSTIWRWKKENENKYLGSELSKIDLLEQFLDQRDSAAMIRTYLKLTTTLTKILNSSSQFQKILSGNKEKFVRSVLKYQNQINL